MHFLIYQNRSILNFDYTFVKQNYTRNDNILIVLLINYLSFDFRNFQNFQKEGSLKMYTTF